MEASARGIRSWRLHWGPTLARGGVPLTWASPGGNNIILERRPAPRGVASVRRRGAAVAGPEEDAAPRCRALVPRAETHYGHPWGLRGQHLRPQRGGNGWRAGSSGNNISCTVLAWAATVVHVSRLGALHFGVQASLLTWLGGTLPRKCWWAARGRSGLEVVCGNAEPVRRAIRPWGRLRRWCRGTSEKMLPRSSHRLDHFSDFLLGLPTGDTNGHP